jgi:microcystin degradation protein MlrC
VIEPDFQTLLPKIRGLMRMPGSGPIVLAEPSDNIGGGAPGDGTGLLQEFLRHQIGRSAVVINDPVAVEKLHHVLIADTVKIQIGGASDFPGAGPVSLKVKLLARTDGRFELEDAQSHLASIYGKHIDMGSCVTVRHDLPNGEGILIVLTSKKTPPFDLGQLRSQWVKPESMAVIGVKAAVAHRRAYEPIAKAMLTVATPGPCSSDLKTLPYRHVRRPVFPLDGK